LARKGRDAGSEGLDVARDPLDLRRQPFERERVGHTLGSTGAGCTGWFLMSSQIAARSLSS